MTRYLAVIAVLAASPCLAQETRTIVKGATDQSVYIRIVDAADGTPETGVTQATSGLDLEYVRNRAAAVDLTESDLAAVDSAHSDGGIKHVGGGVYRVDVQDAAFLTGADSVLVGGTVTDMVVIPARIQLTGFDLQTATQAVNVTTWSGTAVATPDTAGYPKVTIKDGTGAGEIDTTSGGVALATGQEIEVADADLRSALGMAAADLDTQLEDIAAIAAAVDIDEASLTSAVWAYNSRTLTAGTNIVPRINMRPDPGFTFQVSRRADGTYKCTRPLRIAPGAVETIHPAIDMSPLFGPFNYVQTVGTPSISGGSLTVAAEGARDTYAILEVDGTATASEERTITVVVTMTSGASVQVKLDVEVFDE